MSRTRREPCPPGDFALDAVSATALGALVGQPVERLEVGADGMVRLGGCAAPLRLKAKRKVTRLAGGWPVCGVATKVRLAGRQPSPECVTIRGKVRAKKTKPIAFSATRLPATTTTTAPAGASTTTTRPPGATTTTTLPPGPATTTSTFVFPSTTTFTFPTSTVTTTSTTTSTAPPPPAGCGNGIVDAGEECEGAEGCDDGAACTATCECADLETPLPAAQTRIADALAAGVIDYPTSLVYRAFALFGDGRLPVEYDGEAWQSEDTTLFIEIGHVWAELDPSVQALLQPFLTRPSEPGSYWDAGPPAPGLAGLAATELSVECPYQPGADRPDWRFTETPHFVVWSCGEGDPESDVDAEKRAAVAAVAETVWDAMVPETGPPKPDDYDAGPAPANRTDVYLVTPHLCKRRQGTCAPIPVDDGVPSLAAVATSSPCGPGAGGALTTSGYMILDRLRVPEAPPETPSRFRYIFAHEFFHLIENALNLEAQGGSCGAGGDRVRSWLVEASAEWASWAYFPDDGPVDRDLLFRAFQRRTAGVSLRALDGIHPYEAFLYPFFVQQERGGRTAVVDFWTQAGAARNPEQLDDRLDLALPFAEHFRDFAVRNFNTTAAELPGDPLPLASRHQQQDPALAENLRPPVLRPSVALDDAPAQIARAASVAPLAAQYEHYVVGEGVRWVRIDAGPLSNSSFVQLDALVNVEGGWERRRAEGGVFEFCRDDEGDDIGELYLVLSHHDRRPGVTAGGTYDVLTRASCPAGWSGTIRYTITQDEHSYDAGPSGIEIEDDRDREEHVWTVASTILPAPPPAPPADEVVVLNWRGRYEKDRTWQRLDSGGCVGQPVYGTTKALGLGSGTDTLTMRPHFSIPNAFLPETGLEFLMNHIEGERVSYFEICTGQSGGSTEALENFLDLLPGAVIGTPGLAELVPPDPMEPSRFHGDVLLFEHEEPRPGGFDRLEARVRWELRRR